MKRITKIFPLIAIVAALCSCGDDRSSEFYEMTKENQWMYNTMKESYLWGDSIGEIKQQAFFANTAKFFSQLTYKTDDTSFFTDSIESTTYGFKFSLMRDPLGIAPAKVYALVEYVEPESVAATAGLERGMWISTINGKNINMGTGAALTDGAAITLGINQILFDDDTEEYMWEELPQIDMQAASKVKATSLPIVEIINGTNNRIGYILCNSFDNESAIAGIDDALSTFSSQGVTDIVLDLRYNRSHSLANAAKIAAAFMPADKQGDLFCSLYKDLKLTIKEDVMLPQATASIGDKPLYIITTAQTHGTANALIKAIRLARGSSACKVVGEAAKGGNLATECMESPYRFKINPVTAIVIDANGEPLAPTAPDYRLTEIGDYKHIYPLGDKQEYILYNIAYIIENGTLPANK